ncbi:hypothetical protein T08_1772 [Trichinella sp. T8]|nr:hypothetical protein T08_1772 [Trichinella sp. T8]
MDFLPVYKSSFEVLRQGNSEETHLSGLLEIVTSVMFLVKLTRVVIFLRKANNRYKYGLYRLDVLLSVASRNVFCLTLLALCFAIFLVLHFELSAQYELTSKLVEAASCDDQRLF